jgi:hypothetical protein
VIYISREDSNISLGRHKCNFGMMNEYNSEIETLSLATYATNEEREIAQRKIKIRKEEKILPNGEKM